MTHSFPDTGKKTARARELCDVHCHLQDPALRDDIEGLIDRAADGGVLSFVSCGTEPLDWVPLAVLSDRYPQITPFYGLHPWKADLELDGLAAMLEANPRAGVGEIGLDTLLTDVPMDRQISVFENQLHLAKDLERPVAIHCVKAFPSMLERLRRVKLRSCMMHGFSGGEGVVDRFVELGCWFSVNASIIPETARKARRVAKRIPLERLLVETDAPGFAPQGRDVVNEPATLPQIIAALADLLRMDRHALEERLRQNTKDWLGNCA